MSLKTILKNFLNHVETLEAHRKVGKDLFETDFQKLKGLTEQLKHDKEYDCAEGLRDVNRKKNRYKDILPYDYTRVVLSEYPGVPGSDYINANYIKGASGSLAYIASQGPLPNTIVDFWRMIWECEVQVIVMACNEQESGKYKCERYWPFEEEKKQYGNINVELVKWRQVCPDFLVRTLKACWEDEERVLCQFHYTTWPDHGVPVAVQPILELVRLIRDCQASEAVPVLIHCSAGCGRTGTICAIDYVWGLMRAGKLTKTFNLFNGISDMRKQRIAMVQTKEQYVLVHKAVSSLFEQQLRVIDSHTYENLDEDGEPLVFKELCEESVYEDIMEPVDNVYKQPEGENEGFLKAKDCVNLPEDFGYPSPKTISSDKVLSPKPNYERQANVSKKKSCQRYHPVELNHSLDSSQTNVTNLQVSNDSDCQTEDSSLPSSRNSTILRKLCREESVKRLISGWNRAVQQLEDSKVDKVEKNESRTLHVKHKCSLSKEHRKSDRNKEKSHPNSMECDKGKGHRNSDGKSANENSPLHCKNKSHENNKVSPFDESQHSGKLVGKATVIRRPSIAKLKALFEKSPALNIENATEESSQRRRPLFRSHSHYVGHTRTYSVPDAKDMHAELTIAHHEAPVTTTNSYDHLTIDILGKHSNQHLIDRNMQNSQKRARSPEKSHSFSIQSNEKHNREIYSIPKSDSREIDRIDVYQNNAYLIDAREKNFATYRCSEDNVPEFDPIWAAKVSPYSSNDVQENNLQRNSQYSSPASNNSQIQAMKPDNREICRNVLHEELKPENKTYIPQDCSDPQFNVKENNLQKMISKSDDFCTSPKLHNNYSEKIDSNEDSYESENTMPKSFLAANPQEKESHVSENTKEKNDAKFIPRDVSNIAQENPDSMRRDNFSIVSTKHEPLYGHLVEFNLASSKLVSNVYNQSVKDVKYSNINTLSQKNIQQIEERIKKHPRGAIIDLTSRNSYLEDSSIPPDRPPTFMSTNQPVKLSQPMESQDIKVPEKREHRPSNSQCQRDSSSKNKVIKIQQPDDNHKNLLLHSPPPKSKRSHSSRSSHTQTGSDHKESHQEDLFSVRPKECVAQVVLMNPKDGQKGSSQVSQREVKSSNYSMTTPTGPASRSDPRYFPVTTTTPKQSSEDTKYLEKHLLDLKQGDNVKQTSNLGSGYCSSSFGASAHYQVGRLPPNQIHSSVTRENQISKILPKPYTPQSYKPTDQANTWRLKTGEEIYGVHQPGLRHLAASSVACANSAGKPKNDMSDPYAIYGKTHIPLTYTKSSPMPYTSTSQENTYSTPNSSLAAQHNIYPLGPPKPPRLYNHKFKPETSEHDNAKISLPHEGGRYLISVASPKQGGEQDPDYGHNNDNQNIEFVPISAAMRANSHYSSSYPEKLPTNEHFVSRSHPPKIYSNSGNNEKIYHDAVTHRNFVTPAHSDHSHRYHTSAVESTHPKLEPLYSTVRKRIKPPDYENMHDVQQDCSETVSTSKPNIVPHTYHNNTNVSQGIQYSLSDASIYGVIQNHQKPLLNVHQLGYESKAAQVFESNIESSVPKRLYFDTLQRRHKQQVSWEQQRSHDDMDIRLAPSARLKEQIHARRSLVELDSLEISIANENGFHGNSLLHSFLPPKDSNQSNWHTISNQKKPPLEFSDTLATKDLHRKTQILNKEPGSFSGTLYKAFGKLTSFTKFSAKDNHNRSSPEYSTPNTKSATASAEEEKSNEEYFAKWSQQNTTTKEHRMPSEQWTEV